MSKTKGSKKKSVETKAPREPNAREKEAIAAAEQSRVARPARAQFDEEPDETGVMRLSPQHADQNGHNHLVMETFGTTAGSFVDANILRLANITMNGKKPSIDGLNASLALIGAIGPQNELEAALAVQMAATHELSLEMLKRTKVTESREAMRDYGNLATKLQRTLLAQVKTLSDWRRGGEQVVRHVHVYEGGQAVVAEMVNVGGPNARSLEQPYGGLPDLRRPDPSRDALSAASDQGQEAVPVARGRSRKRGSSR